MPNIALDSTPQQVADFVVAHLYKQGKPAMELGRCVYRKPIENGTCLMCAVGCLLTDEEFSPEHNREGLGCLLRHHLQRLEGNGESTSFYVTHYQLLERLQDVHDLWCHDQEGKCHFGAILPKLQQIYARNGFTFPDLTKLY